MCVPTTSGSSTLLSNQLGCQRLNSPATCTLPPSRPQDQVARLQEERERATCEMAVLRNEMETLRGDKARLDAENQVLQEAHFHF